MKVIDDDDFDHFKKFARKGKFFEMLSWGLGGRRPPRNLRYSSFVVRRRRRHPPEIGRYGFGRKKPPSQNEVDQFIRKFIVDIETAIDAEQHIL